jgi:tRNA-Thr(GGU) m(6)t(6)A37 methyltransferase TsaA
MSIQMEPIGQVSNEVAHGSRDVRWESILSTITLSPQWTEGLDGIDAFSHVIVIFYLDRAKDDEPLRLRTHPMGWPELPEVGIFATRSPFRPNGIGATTVKLLHREGNTLTVEGLDAYDGTPVLDIKPYLTRGDSVADARVADWVRKLWQMLDETA